MSKINSTANNDSSKISQSQQIESNDSNQEFGDIRTVEKSTMTEDGNMISFLNSISDILEEQMSKDDVSSGTEKNSINDIAFALDAYFEDKEGENFEWYQRAGKFFFRYEHDLGRDHSKTMKESFETIVKNKIKKNHGHYIITPNSTSVIFR